jgi:hypothetical protein
MKIREDEWLKGYHAKLKEVKSRPTNQYSRIPEGMFWKLPSGVPIKGGYIPVPKDMRHAEWKKKWGVQTTPEEEVRWREGRREGWDLFVGTCGSWQSRRKRL